MSYAERPSIRLLPRYGVQALRGLEELFVPLLSLQGEDEVDRASPARPGLGGSPAPGDGESPGSRRPPGPPEAADGARDTRREVDDYLAPTSSLLAPTPTVGGRLRSFVGAWRRITQDRWILSTLESGYRLEFSCPPPPPPSRVRTTPVPRESLRARTLSDEISLLLRKGAIVPLRSSERTRFSSTFFLAPKKGGTWRPILNLKPLNEFIRPPHFRMETLAVILPQLRPGDWAASIDLTDAYLHIPIHRNDSQFLCFRYQGITYRFTCLPFGLSTAPRVFTRVTRIMVSFLRRRGVRVHAYLDDWLIVGSSYQEALEDTQTTLDLTRELGWLVNQSKSELTPSQYIHYLGARIDFIQGRAFPSEERLVALASGVALLRDHSPQTARAWLVLLGFLASLVDLVPDCRLYMRPIQLHLLAFFRPASRNLKVLIPPAPHLYQVFQWWCDRGNSARGVEFRSSPPTFCLTSDASLEGWGAHAEGAALAHLWEEGLRGTHINVLELLAVFRALRLLQARVRGRSVLVRCDNTAAVSYINRQGGTRSLSLWSVTWDLFQWCRTHRVTLRAVHLPGKENSIADALSRIAQSPTEWSLDPTVAEQVFRVLHRPEVDLFASPLNHKLPRFCTRVPMPGAWAVDALVLDWAFLDGYAFPPFALVGRVVEKAAARQCRTVLIAPFWPSQIWFQPLLRLVAGVPRLLPGKAHLLSLPAVGTLYPHPEVLHLTAWSLSGVPSERRDFRRRLPLWRPTAGVSPHFACMIRDCDSIESGRQVARFLLLKPL